MERNSVDIWGKYMWVRAKDIQFQKSFYEPVWKVASTDGQINIGVLRSAFYRYSRRFFTSESVDKATIDYIVNYAKVDIQRYPYLSLYMINQARDKTQAGIYKLDGSGRMEKVSATYNKKLVLTSLQGMWWYGNGLSFYLVVDLDQLFKSVDAVNCYMDMLISLGVVAQSIIMAGYEKGLGGWMTPAINEDIAKQLLGIDSPTTDAMYFVKLGYPNGQD